MSRDLRTLLREAAAQPRRQVDESELVGRVLRRRSLARMGGIVAVVVTGIVGVALALQFSTAPNRTEVGGQPTSPHAGEPTARQWRQLPEDPVVGRVASSVVWADDRLLVWGGEEPNEERLHDTGAAYMPDSGTWSAMAEAPISPRSGQAAVWTGEEMIVCCGRTSGEAGAAAYDPDADSWRPLPPSPVASTQFAVAVWTGQDMVVTGGVADGGAVANRVTAAYRPDTNRWRTLPDVPVDLGTRASAVWTGERMVVWPADGTAGLALNVAAERWGPLQWPPEGARPADASMVWTGREVLLVGAGATDDRQLVAAAYEPSRDRWRSIEVPLPPAEAANANRGSQAAVWTGTEMIVWTGHLGTGAADGESPLLAYDPTARQWRDLVGSQTSWRPDLAWTGTGLLVIGRDETGNDVGLRLEIGPASRPDAAPSDS